LTQSHWIGGHGFEFLDLTLEPPAADPERIDAAAIRAARAGRRTGSGGRAATR
jgi:hypothetical protein